MAGSVAPVCADEAPRSSDELLGCPSPRVAADTLTWQRREEAMKQVALMAAKYREESGRRIERRTKPRSRTVSEGINLESLGIDIESLKNRRTPTNNLGSAPEPTTVPAQSVEDEPTIILDWDDTLLPTWFIIEVVRPCLPPELRKAPLPPDSPFYDVLKAHAAIVREVLLAASSVTHVAIVTLAQRPWALASAQWYLPGLDLEELLEELDIRVYYAREHVRSNAARQAAMEASYGIDPYIVAKRSAMVKCLRRFYRKSNRRPNVLSIGDSTIEKEAVKEVLWSFEDKNGRSPLCKTIKLMEEPNVEQLGHQLQLVTAWFKRILAHPNDTDIDITALGSDSLFSEAGNLTLK